jgi:anti-sigma B factor antagonist
VTDHFSLSLGGLRLTWDTPQDSDTLQSTGVQVHVQGDLDTVTVPVFQEVLDGLYQQGCFVVRLDLAHLEFIDSSGLGAMVGAWRHCREHEGQVTALAPTVSVRRLMDMTGISTFLLAPR